MSGIFGIVRFDNRDVDRRDLERMGATMRHRAINGMRSDAMGPVGLGHCAMRIYNEDRFDAQPLYDADMDATLVAVVRLDNREALAEALAIAPDQLATMADSALLMAAYRKWGEDCPTHLLGDFAFAIWDGRQRRLLLARDHMGIGTLVYHHGPDFIAFASEIKALWAVDGVPRDISDDGAMQHLLLARNPKSRQTMFDGICGLRGGEWMTIDQRGKARVCEYWTPQVAPEHLGQDDDYYIATYRRIVGEAVACRVRRLIDPPALAFSGGFDSTAIAGLAAPELNRKGHRLIAVSSAMSADRPGLALDPRPMVELCRRDMPHLDVHYVTRENLDPLEAIERSFSQIDVPPSTYHYAYTELARVARQQGARLILDGHGGDTSVNPRGGGIYLRWLKRGKFRRYFSEIRAVGTRPGPQSWRRLIGGLYRLLPTPVLKLGKWARRGFTPVWAHLPLRDGAVRAAIRSGRVDLDWGRTIATNSVIPPSIIRSMQRMSSNLVPASLEMTYWTNGMAMARPFMDKRVIELALAIPDELQIRNGRNRYLACQALADIYPPEFLSRPFANDRRVPEWEETMAAMVPELERRIDSMAGDERLARLIDTGAMKRQLAADGPFRHGKPGAFHAYVFARYLRWFSGTNAGSID